MAQLIDYIRRYLVEHQKDYQEWLKKKGAQYENES